MFGIEVAGRVFIWKCMFQCLAVCTYMSLWCADERHRAIRDVLLLDGITKCFISKLQEVPGPLLIHTLATLATIPHYDLVLYDETAAQLLLRRGSSGAGGRAMTEPSLGVADAVTAILAFSKVKHRSKNGRMFLTEMMAKAEKVCGGHNDRGQGV